MGQCTSCKTTKVKPAICNESINSQIEELRDEVISEKRRLHKLVLDCKDEIENCIPKNNKELAVLIKLKQAYIKIKSKSLQDLIKKIDEILPELKLSKKKEIIYQGNKIITDTHTLLLSNDLNKIMEGDSEYNNNLMENLKKANLDVKEIEKDIEEEFIEKNSSPSKLNRKRYNKKHAM